MRTEISVTDIGANTKRTLQEFTSLRHSSCLNVRNAVQISVKYDNTEYVESFEMWCWRRMEKTNWSDRVINGALRRIKEKRNILRAIKRLKANWSVHILRSNCHVKHMTGEKLEGAGRRAGRHKQLMDETTGYRKFKEEALERTLWRTCFASGCGPVVRQIEECRRLGMWGCLGFHWDQHRRSTCLNINERNN
jgi:hypothetical protein